MIQDILPYEYDNRYRQAAPTADDRLVFIGEQAVLLKETADGVDFPRCGEIAEAVETTYLFTISEQSFFYAPGSAPAELTAKGYRFCTLAELRRYRPQWLRFAGVTAYQLGSWYRANRYCGRCGSETQKDSRERMLRCEGCGHTIYPKIAPAVIVAVTDGDKLLLTRYAGATGSRYALVAGFAEIGETIEDTVRREIMEETGVRVKNLRYYKSQPWSFSDTLLLGFFCELDGSAQLTVDHNELADAEWCARADLPSEPDNVSLTYEMIAKFQNGEL